MSWSVQTITAHQGVKSVRRQTQREEIRPQIMANMYITWPGSSGTGVSSRLAPGFGFAQEIDPPGRAAALLTCPETLLFALRRFDYGCLFERPSDTVA